uniref:Uncharacterized protein n=1 Tax=Lepeophtheirus salmonis TaxID=72036 RepID=A0A0K2TTN8_LEPSM
MHYFKILGGEKSVATICQNPPFLIKHFQINQHYLHTKLFTC